MQSFFATHMLIFHKTILCQKLRHSSCCFFFIKHSLRRQPRKVGFHAKKLYKDQALLIGLLSTTRNDWLHDRTDDCDSMWVQDFVFLLYCMNIQENMYTLSNWERVFTSRRCHNCHNSRNNIVVVVSVIRFVVGNDNRKVGVQTHGS